ncbi:hypothetical protein C8R44DRAFT_988364 [Mycena epipterygia]|nr:hypothetical protein C8R44DRAFT_988364 [Mycena epipterygia]
MPRGASDLPALSIPLPLMPYCLDIRSSHSPTSSLPPLPSSSSFHVLLPLWPFPNIPAPPSRPPRLPVRLALAHLMTAKRTRDDLGFRTRRDDAGCRSVKGSTDTQARYLFTNGCILLLLHVQSFLTPVLVPSTLDGLRARALRACESSALPNFRSAPYEIHLSARALAVHSPFYLRTNLRTRALAPCTLAPHSISMCSPLPALALSFCGSSRSPPHLSELSSLLIFTSFPLPFPL